MNKVSIVLPVYNVEEYLGECLDSILGQTHNNIEVIVVDDGTKDKSGIIADEYALNDTRVKVIHKENGGVASARNAGLKAATGEFLLFVDPDDWITQDHVEYLLHLQSLKDADVCMTTQLFTQKGELQSHNIVERHITPEEAATLLLSPDMYVGTYSKLYRRQWLLDNDLWQNETIYSGEGLHFTITTVQYANCITISNKKIYYYRRNVSKSATTKFNVKMFSNNEYSLNVIKKEKRIDSPEFDMMWHLFRINLFISGIVAIESHDAKNLYPQEYSYWMSTIKSERLKIILSRIVPFKSKIRIIFASCMPKVWSKLAVAKRERIFKESV